MVTYMLIQGGDITTAQWDVMSKSPPVHGDSGRMGGRVWDGVAAILATHNHQVFAPTLEDEHWCDLTGHIRQVCALITDNRLYVILVGHSSGGMVITGSAASMSARIRRLVYADAAPPDPGQSQHDILNAAHFDPQFVQGLEYSPVYTEKMHFDQQAIRPQDKTYIRCTRSEFAAVTDQAMGKIRADETGRTFRSLPAKHFFQADMPGEFAELLLSLDGD